METTSDDIDDGEEFSEHFDEELDWFWQFLEIVVIFPVVIPFDIVIEVFKLIFELMPYFFVNDL